jgi:hypothetical protein
MRCREAIAALLERELAGGSAPGSPALRAHLAACPRCAARAVEERALSAVLRELRDWPPPPVDVTARVLAELPGIRQTGAEEVSTRQLGWAAAAALACSLGLLATLWRLLPGLGTPLHDLWALAASLRHPLFAMLSAAATLLATSLKAVGRLFEGLAPLVGALQGLEPLVIGALATCAAIMAGTIVFVVGRDLRAPIPHGEGES